MSKTDDSSTPPHRSRLEDEVLEILARADQPTSLSDHIRRRTAARRRARFAHAFAWVTSRSPVVSDGAMLVASLVTAIVAMLIVHDSALAARILAVVSIVLLLAPIVLHYRRPRSTIKTWRGRDMDLRPGPPDWVESLRDRFRRPPRR